MNMLGKTMKAAVWYSNADIRIEELPLRRPGPREMLVKVEACGICGSDVVEWYRAPRAPLVQGHELGGVAVEVGPAVTGFAVGDRVFVAPKAACGECRYCRAGHFPQCTGIKERLPGGFAEYVLVPEPLIRRASWVLPDSLSFDQAVFIEPLACVIRAQTIAGLDAGGDVLILGCGMSGLLHVMLAKKKNCRVAVTDVDPKRLERARGAGADLVLPASDNVPEKTAAFFGHKADVVILCTAAPAAIEQAWAAADAGGAIVFFAVPGPETPVTIPINSFWTREMRIFTSYYCGPPDIEKAMRLLATGDVEVGSLVTHRLPLERTAEGFRLVIEGKEAIKVIIEPQRAR